MQFVSIHASVKDATAPLFITLTYNPVSIHASVKDATYIRNRCQCWIMVSIHASVKDATRPYYGYSYRYGFNPRICKRCDSILLTLAYIVTSFNPRICKRCDC